MSTVYLFNPCNDIALVQDNDVFTPPANAALFQRVGAPLPLWLASTGDFVLDHFANRQWYEDTAALYGLSAGYGGTIPEGCTDASPWGWSRNTVRLLTDAGMSRRLLPDDGALARRRALSHRRTAILINAALAAVLDSPMPPAATEVHDMVQLEQAVADRGGAAFVKAPYSSSGRGVLDTRNMSVNALRRNASGILRRQRSVTVEAALDRVCDFAMLFHAGSRGVSMLGYSLFDTRCGAYTGNRLMSDDAIRDHIAAMTGEEPLHQIERELPRILTGIIGDAYLGYMGVDMMVYRHHSGRLLVAPCIELNLRMTMGVYAHLWRARHLAPGVTATLAVTYVGKRGAHTAQSAIVEGQKLTGGTQLLVPPGQEFEISVTVC